MMAVEVRIVLTEKQHAGLKRLLRREFGSSVQEQWFDDRYRHVPEQKRTAVIIRSNPQIAAAHKVLAALQNTSVSSSK